MTAVVEIAGVALLALGLLLATIGLYGMVRHPGIFDQLHAAGLVTGPAIILILAAAIAVGEAETITSAALVILFVLITSPLSGHAIAQAARRRERPPQAQPATPAPTARQDRPMGSPAVVMCAVGTPDQPLAGVHAARALATELGGRLRLVHVFDPMAVSVPATGQLSSIQRSTDDVVRAARVEAWGRLADASRLLDGMEHDSAPRAGPGVPELLADAREHGASLLVTAPAGGGTIDWFLLGSVSADLAARAPCPVLVVTDTAVAGDGGPLVCGYDGSDHGLRAARHAAELAAALGEDLVLVHVRAERDDEAVAGGAVADAAATLGTTASGEQVAVHATVAQGDPAAELSRLAEEHGARFVVAGTRGRGALTSALLGSVSADLVRTARRPILLVPPTVELSAAGES